MKLLVVFTLGVLLTSTSSCVKRTDCFDKQLYNQYKNSFCTMDCPGVVGCDGKNYCNECMANREGIRIK